MVCLVIVHAYTRLGGPYTVTCQTSKLVLRTSDINRKRWTRGGCEVPAGKSSLYRRKVTRPTKAEPRHCSSLTPAVLPSRAYKSKPRSSNCCSSSAAALATHCFHPSAPLPSPPTILCPFSINLADLADTVTAYPLIAERVVMSPRATQHSTAMMSVVNTRPAQLRSSVALAFLCKCNNFYF